MRVGLFVTCLVDLMRPRIGFAALKLLESSGMEVVVPTTQTCCGQPAYNTGDRQTTLKLAQKLMDEFRDCDYIVAPSGSCAAMLRIHYPRLFEDKDEALQDAKQFSARVYELTDFLATIVKLEHLPSQFSGDITYHDACSGLRELGIKTQPRALLQRLPDVHLKEMQDPELCCGFGGTFSIKFGDLSSRMAKNKCADIAQTRAQTIVAGDLGCLLNIEGYLTRQGNPNCRVLHIAEVLAGESGE